MELPASTAFMTLFAGRDNCYGVHVPESKNAKLKEGDKRKGKSFTKREPLTAAIYSDHLNGKQSIGVVPITVEQKCNFAAIDIDRYPCDPKQYVSMFDRYGVPFTCFRSKSGGLHAFIFFRKPELAKQVVDMLNEFKLVLGLSDTTETFPKQAFADHTAVGNWINLPYYNHLKTERYAYDSEGKPLDFVQAMELCWSRRTTLKDMKDCIEQLPFSSGPPCLQAMYLMGEVREKNHNRNIFLFNSCVYLKARNPEDFDRRLKLINQSLPEPQGEDELQATVLNSHKKGDYSYQCDNAALRPYCMRSLCEQRKYGKSCTYVSDLNFEQLYQYQADPPFYEWVVNGTRMRFNSEFELRRQDKFQDYCIRYLYRCPNTLKESVWYGILGNALKNIKRIAVAQEEVVSDKTVFLSELNEFLLERTVASSLAQVALGQVYFSEEDKRYYFRINDLLRYSKMSKVVSSNLNDIYMYLKEIGGKAHSCRRQNSKATFQAWSVPADKISPIVTATLESRPALEERKSEQDYTAVQIDPVQLTSSSSKSSADRLRETLNEKLQLENFDSIPTVKFPPKRKDRF
jgi:hypothetical protein